MPETTQSGEKSLSKRDKKGSKKQQSNRKKEEILEQTKTELAVSTKDADKEALKAAESKAEEVAKDLNKAVEGELVAATLGIKEASGPLKGAAVDKHHPEPVVQCSQCRRPAHHVRDTAFRCNRCGYFTL